MQNFGQSCASPIEVRPHSTSLRAPPALFHAHSRCCSAAVALCTAITVDFVFALR